MKQTPNISRKHQEQEYARRSVRNAHPLRVMLFVTLFGLASLFAGLLWAFWMSADASWKSLSIPRPFLVSSVVIFMSSVAIHLAKTAFRHEQRKWFRSLIGLTFGLGILFLISQVIGWAELTRQGFTLTTNDGSAYLYLISGLHGIHLAAGLLALGFYANNAFRYTAHPGPAIFFFTDANKSMHLKLLAIYWHFVDGVWLFLMAVFLWQLL